MSRSVAKRAEVSGSGEVDRALYESDFYSWAIEQARLLREGRLSEVDLGNVAEEIETLGRSERSAFRSYLARVIQHMLKWDYQPERRHRGWLTSIAIHWVHTEQQLGENPGLKGQLPQLLDEAYRLAVAFAMEDTGLERSALPTRCPYDLKAIRTRVDQIEAEDRSSPSIKDAGLG